ncbi:MAG: hypothetical protein ACK5MD_02465 [Flavobacteriales bacterium]
MIIHNKKKKIKTMLLSISFLIILIIVYLYFFLPVPKFTSEKTIKNIKKNNTIIVWKEIVGVLDQDFPDYIVVKESKTVDTICQAHNIANVELIDNTVKIDFYGTPRCYDKPIFIPKSIFGFDIKVDSSKVRKCTNTRK